MEDKDEVEAEADDEEEGEEGDDDRRNTVDLRTPPAQLS